MVTNPKDLSSLRIDRSGEGTVRKRRRLRRLVFWSVLVVLLAGGWLLANRLMSPGVEVQLVSASLTSPAQTHAVLTASGYVVARRKAAVASKGTGTLVFLGVEEGDRVKKGQVIARLEDADVAAALQRSRENLRVAEADFNDAKLSLERSQALLKLKLVAEAEYDAADARYKRVVASIEAAKFAVKEAEVAVENTRIIAPFDGTVLKKNADVGEIVAPLAGAASSRAAVVTIADMSSLEVDADVSEGNLTRVAAEQDCEIRLDAYPQKSYLGRVSKIVPTADRAKATVLVKIKFTAYDERVLPDMSAKINFLSQDFKPTPAAVEPLLALPASAVTTRNGRTVVYQVKENRAVEASITAGRKIGSFIEVKAGLKEGDKVVANADERLGDGTKVTIKQ